MYPSENYLIRNQTNYFKGVFIQNKSRDIFTIRFITISIENIFIVDIEFFFIFELLFLYPNHNARKPYSKYY